MGLSGAGGLLWEVLWQQSTALALGASAFGAAVTLAGMMAGFAVGGLYAARLARRGRLRAPLVAYGRAEVVVAIGGVLVGPALRALGALDTVLYAASPSLASVVQLCGVALVLIVPSAAMGATLPLLAVCAPSAGTSIARLYGANTLGAVIGILAGTFVLVPLFGLFTTGLVTAGIDLAVALWAIRHPTVAASSSEAANEATVPWGLALLAFASGLSVFLLEVSWFRSLRAAFQSSTETFGVLVAAFLLPLSVGARLAPRLRRRFPEALPLVLGLGAAAVLCATPIVDQLDRWALTANVPLLPLFRFVQLLVCIAVPVTLLGLVFPWLLEERPGSSGSGRLYAANTAGAVLGALGAGFLLLPTVGATRTSWIAAGVLALAGAAHASRASRRAVIALVATAGLVVAVRYDGGGGRRRVQGGWTDRWGTPIYVAEGPDATVSVSLSSAGERSLVIDGFEASTESVESHYMRWMGHLPTLATPAPLGDALVICFGTGQTANAVRQHHPRRLDLVDINAAVLRAGPLFAVNERVLEDPAVHPTVMDGRAFLRRAVDRRYDVVTLEPMPPNFAGVNNLYSREFYELVRARLSPHGIAAQWVPVHLLSPGHMLAVISTFVEAFPHSRLWCDTVDGTCILVGGPAPWSFRPSDVPLDLDAATIARGVTLEEDQLAGLAAIAETITDDNQLLAYGTERLLRYRYDSVTGGPGLAEANHALLDRLRDIGDRHLGARSGAAAK